MSGTLRLSILIEAIDRASRPMAALQARLGAVAANIVRVGQATQGLARASGVAVLAGAFGNLAGRARDAAGAIGGAAGRLALLAGGAGFAFNRLFIQGAADFQDFGVALETVMGNAEAAQRRLAELQQFASRTPFNVNEVVGAGVQLQVLGLRGAAADRALRAAGDAAAVFPGARLADTVGAIGAAMRGELDPLERFGVQARTVGNALVFEWERAGVRIRGTVDKNNRRSIAATIARAWGDVAPDGMARRARTWRGMMSNLGDAWSNFTLAVMQSSPFQWLQDQLRDLLALINRLQEDGTLARWAQETGAAITRAFQAMRDFVIGTEDTPGVLVRMRRAAEAVWRVLGPVVDRIGGFETALIAIGVVILGPVVTALAALTSALLAFGAAMLLTPAGWFLAAVAAIAAAAYLVYENWEDIAAFFGRIWAGIRRVWDSEQVVWLRETLAGAFELAASAVRAAWEPIESFFSALWSGISGAFSAGWAVIEPIVNAVIRGAEALGSILPRGAGRADGASGPVAPEGQRRFGQRGRLEGFYGPAAMPGGAAAAVPPVRLDAGLDLNIRLPDGVTATVTPRGGNDVQVRTNIIRGTLAAPVP
jgi:hypothetical protein